jgi:hypothetical protein
MSRLIGMESQGFLGTLQILHRDQTPPMASMTVVLPKVA